MRHDSVERKNLMEKTSNKLVDLSIAFAVEILNLVKYLKEQRETIICNQIGRAGTSIGANIHEAQYAHGKADFVSKLQIALTDGQLFSLHSLSLIFTSIYRRFICRQEQAVCKYLVIFYLSNCNDCRRWYIISQ